MAVIPINVEDQEIEEQEEREGTDLTGVELLASMFIPSPDGWTHTRNGGSGREAGSATRAARAVT